MSIPDRPMPQAIEAERSLLGGLMQDPDRLPEIAIKPEAFYRLEHARLFELLVAMAGSQASIDMVTVVDRVRVMGPDRFGGIGYVVELPDAVPSTANLPYYARLIQDKADRRRIIELGEQACRAAYGEYVSGLEADDAGKLAGRVGRMLGEVGTTAVEYTSTIGEAAREAYQHIVDVRAGKVAPAIATDFRDLDDMTSGGIRRGDLWVLGGRPGMGKTGLAMRIVEHMSLLPNVRVGVWSGEMSRKQLAARMLSGMTDVHLRRLRNPLLLDEDARTQDRDKDGLGPQQRAVRSWSQDLDQWPIVLNTQPGITVEELGMWVRRMQMTGGLDVLAVDYLQLMGASDRRASVEQQIAHISRHLKTSIARALDVGVIALSQLNRKCEDRADKRPVISDLRASGQIEQDSDWIGFVYREVEYDDAADPKDAELIVRKQRSGPTGTIPLRFDGPTTKFYDAPIDGRRELL
ncbi:MAG: replicative DNA helicase [bacterium]|nr:replicative DNA helicase [bacterium]